MILDWTRDERLSMLEAMGDFNRMENNFARDRVTRFSRQELIAQLSENAGSAR